MDKELPKNIKETLDKWFGSITYKLMYFWESFAGDTFYVVCVTSDDVGRDIHFIRIFYVGESLELSVDHTDST